MRDIFKIKLYQVEYRLEKSVIVFKYKIFKGKLLKVDACAGGKGTEYSSNFAIREIRPWAWASGAMFTGS